MTERRPAAPSGLGAAGRALWRRVTADLDFEGESRAVLELACRQADDVAALEELLATQGLVVNGSQGQPRLTPVVTELRQSRLALAKLLGDLPALTEQGRTMTAGQKRGRRAANARWDRVRDRKEAAAARSDGGSGFVELVVVEDVR